MVIRSFLAFELHPEARHIIEGVSDYLRGSSINGKWVKPENVHLTVVFLGNIETTMIDAMKDEVKKVTDKTEPFSVCLKGIGCFPDIKRPRVLWIGLDGDIKRMSNLRKNLMKRLKPFGIKEEKRAFRPHLTLGRFKRFNQSLKNQLMEVFERYRDISSRDFVLKELTLFRSELKPDGAHYTRLYSFPLNNN